MDGEEENEKLTVRQLISLLTNDLRHIQRRVDRVEVQNWGIILAILSASIAVVVVEVCK